MPTHERTAKKRKQTLAAERARLTQALIPLLRATFTLDRTVESLSIGLHSTNTHEVGVHVNVVHNVRTPSMCPAVEALKMALRGEWRDHVLMLFNFREEQHYSRSEIMQEARR